MIALCLKSMSYHMILHETEIKFTKIKPENRILLMKIKWA